MIFLEEIVKAENIKKEYLMGSSVVKALKGVSLKIERGEFVIIVGPSGSGKSTLLHILGALDHPTNGKVFVEGHDISLLDDWELAMIRRNTMGFIFQAFNLIPTLNALENVVIPTEPMKVDKEEVNEKAAKLLEIVGLGERLYHKPDQLSGGERQRVSIARALINNPKIIYADEPTGNLDSVTGKQVINLMRKMNKEEKKTFVIVTHDTSLLDFATTKYFLHDGEISKVEKGRNAEKYTR